LPKEYGFKERLGFSRGVAETDDLRELLKVNIPSAISVRTTIKIDDEHGTDAWVDRKNLPSLSVDIKIRELDPIQYNPPKDDLALETYSDIDKGTKGWTRNPQKRTDYVMWFFRPTKRWVLIPFPLLCRVFIEKWRIWKSQYRVAIQKTTEDGKCWYSECVFVPRVVIWREIIKRYGGKP